jgi:hypothetical protein
MTDKPKGNLRLQKLEQLCLAVDRYVVQVAHYFTIYERCAAGEYDLNAARNLLAKRGIAEDPPLKAAKMLLKAAKMLFVEGCLPELQATLLEIVKCEARGIGEVIDFKEGFKRRQFKREEIADELSCIHGLLRDADESFKKASHELARALDH